ncbi:pseudouridine synthase [Parasitella parasitica]|nr:pseudouridine synthase [Parasitella parasitica]
MGNSLSRSSNQDKGTKRALESEDLFENLKKKGRFEDEPTIAIKESDVGIVAYVNPHLKGFHSILKFRAEDFLVNEVDMDRNIVHLTSLEPPNTRTKEIKQDYYPSNVFDKHVAEILNTEFAQQFRHFLEHPEVEDAVLTIKTDKDQRIMFYNLVEKHLKAKVNCRGKDGNLVIRWPSTVHNDEYIDWKALGGDYLQVSMYKASIDTMNAINIISKKTSIHPKNFGYAGNKDARAITTQTLTLKSIKPGRIIMAQEDLMQNGIYLGDFKFVPKGLTLGDLKGNHFTIVLRDIRGANEDELELSLRSLQDNGFLNYFGMQRFGTSTVLTHTVGCAIMKKQYEEASNLILDPREGDREEYHIARTLWKDTHDPDAVLAVFPKRAYAERKLLASYARSPAQHAKAIKSLPKNMLSLYSHAYQSYIWNRVVSERARLFGTDKLMVGDLVMVDANKSQDSGKPDDNVGRRNFANRKVPKVLTAQDLESYSIADVVYPLPGKKSVYPDNEIKELYRKFMAQDGISMEKRDNHFDGLNGDYRAMLSKPEQMGWSFVRYNDPTEKLCNTDVDRLENKDEPVGIADGQYLALKVEFTLGTSQYATMALREIMKAETSSQAQSTLSHN